MKRTLLALCGALAFTCTQAQLVEEVPFITSPDNVTQEMLRIARVGAGDHVIDLGSGDGRIVILAAKRFGATGLGVELDPSLVALSQRNARDAGVADRVEFRVQDLFQTELARATVITMYLLPDVNLKLRPTLLALKPGTRLVSHDWDMGDWQPDASTKVDVPDKKIGLDKFSRVHLWIVPAKVDGLWCGAGRQLELKQRHQQLAVRLQEGSRASESQGRVEGSVVHAAGQQLQFADETLRSPALGTFTRARDGRC